MTSTNSSNTSLILKVDDRGRVRTPAEQREALLEEFERCSMSGAAFAKHYGIKYSTFAYWRQARRRKARKQAKGPQAVELAEVVVMGAEDPKAEECAGAMRVELPGGARVLVTNRSEAVLAAVLLRELQGPGSC